MTKLGIGFQSKDNVGDIGMAFRSVVRLVKTCPGPSREDPSVAGRRPCRAEARRGEDRAGREILLAKAANCPYLCFAFLMESFWTLGAWTLQLVIARLQNVKSRSFKRAAFLFSESTSSVRKFAFYALPVSRRCSGTPDRQSFFRTKRSVGFSQIHTVSGHILKQ